MIQDQILAKADELLERIADAGADQAWFQENFDHALEVLNARFAESMKEAKDRGEAAAKALTKHAKAHKDKLFTATDRVDLEHGALIYSKGEHVVRAKGVTVEVLQELDYLEGIKMELSVDWDEIGTWPDEKLTAIGTQKKLKESFGYELKEKKA